MMISIAGTFIAVLLVYYGLRALKLFRANIAARARAYISVGSVFAVEVIMFILEAIQPMALIPIGGNHADCRSCS